LYPTRRRNRRENKTMKKTVIALMVCAGLIGCAHRFTPQQIAMMNDPSIEQAYKNAIRQRGILPGMTPNMVKAIWGKPASTRFVDTLYIWTYTHGLAGKIFRPYIDRDLFYRHVVFKKGKVLCVFTTPIPEFRLSWLEERRDVRWKFQSRP
jgi:hypothetical protein